MGASAKLTSTPGDVHPHSGPRFSANSSDVMPIESAAAPGRSMGWRAPRSVSGSTASAMTTTASSSGACTAKIHRQLTFSTIGPPATTPSTGAPAPTSDHSPIAFTRSLAGTERIIIAMDAGPVAAPSAAPSTRNAISDDAFHASAVSAANTAAPARPITYTRLAPYTSTALPSTGPRTPNASSGPVMIQVSVALSDPMSSAIVPSDTDRIVIVNPTANRPASAVPVIHHS
jgi:hypothetical protein